AMHPYGPLLRDSISVSKPFSVWLKSGSIQISRRIQTPRNFFRSFELISTSTSTPQLPHPTGPAKASSRLHQILAPRDVASSKGGKSELLKSRAAQKIARQLGILWWYGAKSLQVYRHRMIPVFADARRETY